jgi:hypothetical protein
MSLSQKCTRMYSCSLQNMPMPSASTVTALFRICETLEQNKHCIADSNPAKGTHVCACSSSSQPSPHLHSFFQLVVSVKG